MSWADKQGDWDLAQEVAAQQEQELILQRLRLIEPRKGRFWLGVYNALATEVAKYVQKFPHRSVASLSCDRPDPETIDLREDSSGQSLRASMDVDGVTFLDPRSGRILAFLPFKPTTDGLRASLGRKYLTDVETADAILGCLVALRTE